MLLIMNVPLIGLFTRMLTIRYGSWYRPSPPFPPSAFMRCTAPPLTCC